MLEQVRWGLQLPPPNLKLPNRVDDILQTLGEEFVEYIQQEQLQSVKHIPQIIISVAKHQQQRVHVIDPVITMLSCIYEIQGIIKAN